MICTSASVMIIRSIRSEEGYVVVINYNIQFSFKSIKYFVYILHKKQLIAISFGHKQH